MSTGRTVARTALVAVVVVIADQVSKAIVRAEISPVEQVDLILHVKLINTRNTGVAFSMLSGGGPLVVIVAVIALCALLAFFVTHIHRRLVWLPTGLLVGGAAGNLIDRIRLGAVTDFIKIPHWPAFNVADICVTFGVLTLVYVLEKGSMKVPAEAAGERLDVFLAGHLGTRTRAQRLIDAGHVRVDGVPKPKRYVLSGGETVDVDEPEEEVAAPVEPARFAIAYEDEHLIVVDKPAGVVVHPAQGHRDGTLVQALAGRVAGGPDPARPGVVHRLDRDTSGLLLLARDEPTHAALQQALRARQITREYLALVEGRPPARRGTIEAPLGRDRRARTRISTDTDDPHPAITHFETERAFPDDTLLRVTLETGRTHQIRAHLLAIGHPVAGDPEYGHAGRHGLCRQFLHAQRLAFDHPETGAGMDLRAPLPEDLVRALRQASGERADRAV